MRCIFAFCGVFLRVFRFCGLHFREGIFCCSNLHLFASCFTFIGLEGFVLRCKISPLFYFSFSYCSDMVCGNLKEWVIHIISIFNDDETKRRIYIIF